MKYNTHEDAHITAVHHALARDWQSNVTDLVDTMLLQSKSQVYTMHSLVQFIAHKEFSVLPKKDELLINISEVISSCMDFNWMEPLRT